MTEPEQKLRLLVFTTLYPHAAAPNQGVFVENRLRHLLASGQATAHVVAPVPWFPLTGDRFGRWAVSARAPRREDRHGIPILHPRFPAIPRLGMAAAPWLLYRAALPVLRRLIRDHGPFDAIDAHYFYPDGVAALWLARALGLKLAITARGSDLTQIATHLWPRRLIRQAIAGADAVIGVSAALAADLRTLGAPPEKTYVFRNGVDTQLFRPAISPDERASARAALGLRGPTLISVGHLIPRKGHHLVIDAMADLPDHHLLIVGEGEERPRLQAQITRLGLSSRIRLLGAVPHADLPALYRAADILVLASAREGWANVLLEAMACGTPVLASNIPGNPEVVRDPAAGLIMAENTPAGIAAGIRQLAATGPTRAATRAYAEAFDWTETTAAQLALFRKLRGGW